MTLQPKPSLLSSVLRPWPTLLGVVVSFVGCCAAGRAVSKINSYENFQRFHPYINFTTLHYPTVSQVRALGRSTLDREKTIVVVGGNSILHGSSVGSAESWTIRLQKLLGEDYQVINLGVCGMTAQEFGATAAEVLSRDFPKLIFVTNTWAGVTSPFGEPDGQPFIRYFFWEARSRGWLLEDSDRETRLQQLASVRKADPSFRELQSQLRLDRRLFSRDLWTTLQYTHFTTTWCPVVGPTWYRARKKYSDSGRTEPPLPPSVLQRWSEVEVKRLQGLLAANRPFLVNRRAPVGPAPSASLPPTPVEECVKVCFPAACRPRTLILINDPSPFYLNQLTPGEKVEYFEVAALTTETLERAGVRSLEIGKGYPLGHFHDTYHHSPAGGWQMAESVAPLVREMAGQLGYANAKGP